ncbi:MAG: GTP-binding protein [Candidatus Lokiarchaeota archaeon]
MIKFKVVVAGAKNSGKTSLIRRYATGKFSKSVLSTIGVDFETKRLEINGEPILLNIWDFAGEEKFRVLFPSYVSGASGSLMLYDITSKQSLEDLNDWVNVINSAPNRPKTNILIEAKADLEDQRIVPREKGLEVFKKHKFKGELLSTSAKTGKNVEEAFQMLGREILENSLKKCINCGNFYPAEQKFCQFCGKKNE